MNRPKQTKFREGDHVMILDDLAGKSLLVSKVWIEQVYIYFNDEMKWLEKVALGDDKVYKAHQLTFFSEPISRLAEKIAKLEKRKKWYN